MENFTQKKLELLRDIEKLIRAIDDEVDWYLASLREKDPKRRALARNIFNEKQKERVKLAREDYERYK